MTFVSLVLIQFFKAYNYRSDRHSVFHRPFGEPLANLAIAWELALLRRDHLRALSSCSDRSAHSRSPSRDWIIVRRRPRRPGSASRNR